MDTSYSGDYTISWNMAAGDTIPQKYELQEISGESIITDGAENGPGNWLLDGFSITGNHHSGSYGFYSGSANSYHAIMTLAAPVYVSGPTNLTFYINYNIENNYDYGFVEISTDGINFESLDTYTGNSSGWAAKSYNLDSYIEENVYIRFRYDTDVGVSYTGMYLDEVNPVRTYSDVIVIDDNITVPSYIPIGSGLKTFRDGEYSATPRISWLNRSRPTAIILPVTLTTAAISTAWMSAIPFLILRGVRRHFINANAPMEIPYGDTWFVAGDVNQSCTYNGLDITYMVAYLKGGSALQFCPDCPPTW
jgi:hypothetical protein